MKRTRTVAQQYLTVILLVMIGVSFYGCGDSGSISDGPEVRLAALGINSGTLQPAFSPQITGYTVQVPATTTAVTLTATPEDSATTVLIAGDETKSRSVPLGISPGSFKDITILLKSPSGSQSTYTVTVNKAVLAGNTALSALTVTPGTLTPAFDPNTLTYTVNVAHTVPSVTVSATKDDPNATLTGSITAPSVAGQETGQATIQLGGQGSATPVTIIVIAPNGNSDTYRITVNRPAPASDNKLSALTVSAGTLTPPFSPDTVSYAVGLLATDETVTMSATKSDRNAVMTLGSVNVSAGEPTGQVPVQLEPGASMPVDIRVTAQDQSSIKTYTITVTRPL